VVFYIVYREVPLQIKRLMMEKYIDRITGTIPHTNKVIDITLGGKNLIVTGGNGSGKTSFLRNAYDKTVLLIAEKKTS
jgi:Flp pilus assembly CpaF family ATPase